MSNKQDSSTPAGHIHPISAMTDHVVHILSDLGFSVALGPEVEDERHNFDALNVPKEHPARDLQDTFFIAGRDQTVLRTHTSSVQIRYMEEHEPPFAIVAPGKVFRQEATDATHEVQFHQIEGLLVDRDVSMAHLKGVLEEFLKRLFGSSVSMRLRPGYFPFVEPGVEVDLQFRGKWLEVLGAGMVHPNVLRNVGINPEQFRGCAFGIGIDRLAMMKYDIPDVRLLYNGDLRVTQQF